MRRKKIRPHIVDYTCHNTWPRRGKMENLRDAPWIREAETFGYPVGDGTVDEEEEEDGKTL